MKLAIVILFFPLICFGQMTGIQEADSLLLLKDRLFRQSAFAETDEYLWIQYQWEQWIKGKKQRRCMFNYSGITYFRKCENDPGFDPSYIGDTLIYLPLPISAEGFLSWRVKRINSK